MQLLAEQTARSAGIDVIFEGNRDGKRLSPAMEIGLYRIAQEALHNAIKYAEAKTIQINVQQNPNKLVLLVSDNGKGFSIKAPSKSEEPLPMVNGLENMRTRSRLLNGELTIVSKPKKGTIVTVSINLS